MHLKIKTIYSNNIISEILIRFRKRLYRSNFRVTNYMIISFYRNEIGIRNNYMYRTFEKEYQLSKENRYECNSSGEPLLEKIKNKNYGVVNEFEIIIILSKIKGLIKTHSNDVMLLESTLKMCIDEVNKKKMY